MPAFAGNRVGFKVLNECAQLADEHGVAFIDYLIGPYTGRAMPPLATVDLVGWDVHKAIVDNVHANTKDEAHAAFALPDLHRRADRRGPPRQQDARATAASIGAPRRTARTSTWCSIRRAAATSPPADVEDRADRRSSRRCASCTTSAATREAFKVFLDAEGAEADLARKVVLGYVSYALNRVGDDEVVREPRDVDRIMGFGFNWAPPTVLVDVIGVKDDHQGASRSAGLPVPEGAGAAPSRASGCSASPASTSAASSPPEARFSHLARREPVLGSAHGGQTRTEGDTMAAPVYVLGGYQTDFARNWTKESKHIVAMMREAVLGGLEATGIEPKEIEVGHVGNFAAELYAMQGHLGAFLVDVDPALLRPADRRATKPPAPRAASPSSPRRPRSRPAATTWRWSSASSR